MSALVSIIMPSYNTAPFIEESIRSVFAQNYTDWELIIVDDASTDNTDEVVGKFTELAEVNTNGCHPERTLEPQAIGVVEESSEFCSGSFGASLLRMTHSCRFLLPTIL